MKKKAMFIFSVTGVLALSIGLMTASENTEVLAKEQPKSETVVIERANIDNGDQMRVVTAEEQKERENQIEEGDQYTVITVEEQNMVENSLDVSGFVPQENGTGFYFKKE